MKKKKNSERNDRCRLGRVGLKKNRSFVVSCGETTNCLWTRWVDLYRVVI